MENLKSKNNQKQILVSSFRSFFDFKINNNSNLLDLINDAFEKDNSNLDFYFLKIFFNLELENLNEVKKLFNNLKFNKNYYKKNNEKYFMYYNFLNFHYQIKSKKINSTKNARNFFHNSPDKYKYLLGILECSKKNYNTSIEIFRNNYIKNSGVIKLYTYLNLINLEKEKLKDSENSEIIINIIKYGIRKNINIKKILDGNISLVINNLNLNYLKLIYKKYNINEILIFICNELLNKNNFSKENLEFYNILLEKNKINLNLSQLIYIIKLFEKNKIKNIDENIIIKYLETENYNEDILSYIYFLLVRNNKYLDILIKYKNKIIQFAFLNLEKNNINKYLLNIYTYFLKEGKEIEEKYILKAENIVRKYLFSYKIEMLKENATNIWLLESGKKNIKYINISSENLIFNTSTSKYKIIFLNVLGNKISNKNFKVNKLIENEDLKIYEKYYLDDKKINEELLIFLSKYYIETKKYTNLSLEVLKQTLKLGDISSEFRTELNLEILNILSGLKEYKKALEYIFNINYINADKKNLENILNIFLNNKKYSEAIELISYREKDFLLEDISRGIKEISLDEKYNSLLGSLSFNLLINNWYDEKILEIVLNNFNGSLENYIDLNKCLEKLAIKNLELNNKIVKKSLETKILNTEIQKSFKNIYRTNRKLEKEFIYFLIYKVIVEEEKLEDFIINILESEYENNLEDNLLIYCLSKIYLENNINTEISNKIINKSIENMKIEEILLPHFKKSKDKLKKVTYINKNQSFAYRTLPNRKVFLNYKLNDLDEYVKKEMKYFKFGIYIITLVSFYKEKVEYFYTEEIESGEIKSKIYSYTNKNLFIYDNIEEDYFYKINNALIYQQTLNYTEVYKTISKRLNKEIQINDRLL